MNRFVELVEDVVPSLPEGRLRVVDFGSGRSYLTFALHDLLTRVHGREVDVVGLDLKPNVVSECEELARRLGAEGLRFELGDIAEADLADVDLVVSLHACDTATDVALDRAIRAGRRGDPLGALLPARAPRPALERRAPARSCGTARCASGSRPR